MHVTPDRTAAPEQPRKRHPLRLILGGLAILVVVGFVVAAVSAPQAVQNGSAAPGGVAVPVTPATVAPGPAQGAGPTSDTVAAAEPAGQTVPGDGTYTVGTEMTPGKYKSAGPADDQGFCFWFRNRPGVDDPLKKTIASNGTKGQAIVTVKSGEEFESNNCQAWHKV